MKKMMIKETRFVRMGRMNVARSQMGQEVYWDDQARYLGDEVEGACPYCHLAKGWILT